MQFDTARCHSRECGNPRPQLASPDWMPAVAGYRMHTSGLVLLHAILRSDSASDADSPGKRRGWRAWIWSDTGSGVSATLGWKRGRRCCTRRWSPTPAAGFGGSPAACGARRWVLRDSCAILA